MYVLLATNDPFQIEAISVWISKSPFRYEIFTPKSHREVEQICSTSPCDLIVIGNETQPEDQIKWVDEVQRLQSGKKCTIIALVSNPSSVNVALLIDRRVSAIIDIQDAKEYFLHDISLPIPIDLYLSPKIKDKFGSIPTKLHPLSELSKTEIQVASFMVMGLATKEIASKLSRSQQTIEDHRKHIKEKLSVVGGKSTLLTYLANYVCWLLKNAHNQNPHLFFTTGGFFFNRS